MEKVPNVNLPTNKQTLLVDIVQDIQRIQGVKALVLGGSYAMGMATDNSDLDIGIYYSNNAPFDIQEIAKVAHQYSVHEDPTVTAFYEWGPWVNGGAWIKAADSKVDFLYKNIEQIAATIDNAHKGIWENHFEQQPPYGFSSLIFLAETQYCIPLHDPENIIHKLKETVHPYPQKLKHSVIQQSLWSAEFTIWQAESFANKDDVYNTVGCLTRATKNIVTALFALNERYPMGDKRAITILEQSEISPANLAQTINGILCVKPDELIKNVSQIKHLFTEVVTLTQGLYKPSYNL